MSSLSKKNLNFWPNIGKQSFLCAEHLFFNNSTDQIFVFICTLYDKLVMDHVDQISIHKLIGQALMNTRHRKFGKFGSRPLNRHIFGYSGYIDFIGDAFLSAFKIEASSE